MTDPDSRSQTLNIQIICELCHYKIHLLPRDVLCDFMKKNSI